MMIRSESLWPEKMENMIDESQTLERIQTSFNQDDAVCP